LNTHSHCNSFYYSLIFLAVSSSITIFALTSIQLSFLNTIHSDSFRLAVIVDGRSFSSWLKFVRQLKMLFIQTQRQRRRQRRRQSHRQSER